MFNLQDLDKIIITYKIKVLILQRRQENNQVCRQLIADYIILHFLDGEIFTLKRMHY